MSEEQEIKLNDANKALLDQVNELYPEGVSLCSI